MKKHIRKPIYILLFIVLLSVAFVYSSTAKAQLDPRFGVYVQDEANILQEQSQLAYYQNAVWLNNKTGGAQVGILTVPHLGNETIESLAVSRFREMGLGSKEANNGVLLLYTAQENHVRIEIGYGLEGRITDGTAGAILDQYFLPNMKAGNEDLAFGQTQMAIIQKIAEEYGVDPAEINQGSIPAPVNTDSSNFFNSIPGYLKIVLGIGLAILIFLDFKFTGGMFTLGLLSMFRRGGGGSSNGGGWGGRGGGGSTGGGGASR
jgi:uncharacterized protein